MGQPGRPKKQDSQKLTCTLPAVRCSEGDYAQIQEKYAASGAVKFSDFVRQTVLSGQVVNVSVQQDTRAEDIVFQLKKIGNNINQLAKRSNIGHSVEADFEALRIRIDDVLSQFIENHIEHGA